MKRIAAHFLKTQLFALPLAGLITSLPIRGADDAAALASSSAPAPIPIPLHVAADGLRSSEEMPPSSDHGDTLVASAQYSSPGPSALAATSASTPDASSDASAPPPAPPSAMASLVNLLVAQHVLDPVTGDRLIKQSNQELDEARAQAAATQAAADRALLAATTQKESAPAAPPPSDDEEEVAYVPDVVKQQITDQVTQNVLKDTSEERLTAPDTTPEWVKRLRVAGDVRFRSQEDLFPPGNAIGNFTNFNSINTGSGFNVNFLSPSLPQYDVDKDRTLFRLRARLGAEVDLGNGFTTGLRIATGSDDSPVSENQTLGAANSAQGGDFGKYQIWLDRAYIRYELWGKPEQDLSFTVGRFDNPFFDTSMIWSDDLAFDGGVLKGRYQVAKGVTPFAAAGAFPIFNTDLNFSTNQAGKFNSEDKYLFAIQTGTDWQITKDIDAKVAAAFYDFENVQGRVSNPIDLASTNEIGSTDDTRPSFAQNGNTYIALRDYEDPSPGTTQELQYYGLASPFHDVVLTGQLNYDGFDPFRVWLVGEVVKNVAFNRNQIINGGPPSSPGPQNNTTSSDPNSFNGGDTGYDVSLHVGQPSLQRLWDWNISLGYRYVESDATIDGFTDSNFGGSLPGTNLKGYILEGNLALNPRVFVSLRWMSSEAIAGATYRNDLLQFDINARF
jgi:hypothetical protein